MKREGNLMTLIADPDNLRYAFYKARKGKDMRQEVQQFRAELDANLVQLHVTLLSGIYTVSNYRFFKVYEPKERVISAAPFADRVVQHAISNVCHPSFERYQIFDSYASRKGKGIYAALDKAKRCHHTNGWYLKMDVRHFYDSIDHQVLADLLGRRFKDPSLMQLFNIIIQSYHTESGKGLPIGNLTSQYFANHYLALADHYVKEVLGVKCYVRYMDDMVMWSNDKQFLLDAGRKLQQFLSDRLYLKLKLFCLNNCNRGLTFLGYKLYPDCIMLSTVSKKRFMRKMVFYEKLFLSGAWDQNVYRNHLLPLVAFVDKAQAYGVKMRTMDLLVER